MASDDAELKDRLLVAAQHLFAQHGRDGVSLRDIAELARATHGSIRHHYGTKDNLYLAALMQLPSIGDLDKEAPLPPEATLSPSEGEQQLRLFVHQFVAFQTKAGRHQVAAMGLIRAEMSREDGPDPVFYKRVISPGHDRIKGLVRSIRPDIDDEDVLEILTFNIIFQCVMMRIGQGIVLKRLKRRRLTKKDIAQIADVITEVTLFGLRQYRHDR
ncbi:MAG: CerR family C-terminal domain-containing protein [Planctomycetota bacterium]